MTSDESPRRFRWAGPAVAVLLTLIFAEGALRLYYVLKNRSDPPPIELSGERGWRSRPDVDTEYTLRVYGEVSYSTNERGFRSFGSPASEAFKVLALGDSFTQAKQVSDGDPYYDQLAARRPGTFEIFAYGAGGYGTLQQLMVLETYLEEVEPDLILWQFSFNDLFNNDYALESGSSERNNHMRRPYWENGEVVYRHPDGGSAALTSRSYLARRLRIYLDSLRQRTGGTMEQDLPLDDPQFARAIETTRALFRRGVQVAGTTPIIAFQASPLGRFGFEDEAFARVCAGVPGMECIPDMLEVMRQARRDGLEIDARERDGHWNRRGHALAAERIERHLLDAGHLRSAASEPQSE